MGQRFETTVTHCPAIEDDAWRPRRLLFPSACCSASVRRLMIRNPNRHIRRRDGKASFSITGNETTTCSGAHMNSPDDSNELQAAALRTVAAMAAPERL